ncbi:hypothetical protein LWHH1689_1847 [Limosilactobacillus reuteri]|uniref:Uncharacterized protein n=1 Tax=Limosilactobacillus reuteri TaxID=1598 RepID=A0A2S1ET46_LIMRT|nr:hypothetical protein LWHH1689_1847 [Limosilactobacillus reuteri]
MVKQVKVLVVGGGAGNWVEGGLLPIEGYGATKRR